jgi:hypothetical protein
LTFSPRLTSLLLALEMQELLWPPPATAPAHRQRFFPSHRSRPPSLVRSIIAPLRSSLRLRDNLSVSPSRCRTSPPAASTITATVVTFFHCLPVNSCRYHHVQCRPVTFVFLAVKTDWCVSYRSVASHRATALDWGVVIAASTRRGAWLHSPAKATWAVAGLNGAGHRSVSTAAMG